MLTFLLVAGVVVAVVAGVVHFVGRDKVEAELKTVEQKVVDEVKKL